jgi:hypothetical protein
LKPLVAASGDSECTSRMILGRYSLSSIFLMSVSVAIDLTPRGLVADRNMRSERKMIASHSLVVVPKIGSVCRMNPFSFDGNRSDTLSTANIV